MAFITGLPTGTGLQRGSVRLPGLRVTSTHPSHLFHVPPVPSRRISRVRTIQASQQQESDIASASDIVGTSDTAGTSDAPSTPDAAALPDAAAPPSPETASAPSTPGLPKLYQAWFGPEHELANQARAAIELAYDAGVRKMELQWPVVPNVEELAAGTLLNFEFGKAVSRDLGMAAQADYPLIKRYLAQFCNLYWAKQVAQAGPFRARTVWALSTDSVSKERAQGSLANLRLASLRRPPQRGEVGKDDVVVIMDPRDTSAWVKGAKVLPEGGDGIVVFLNSRFNETYGLTGPRNGVLKGTEPVYFLKRITRGYAYRSFPGPWLAYLEKPDLSVEVVGEFPGLPKLSEVAKVVRELSNNRYGGFYNDRYVRGFGGRL